jgi:tRNA(Ile2) C34 agmatinyltransferase TiaS
MENQPKTSEWMRKVADFFDETPLSPEAKQEVEEVVVEGALIPRSLVKNGEVNASELSNELLDLLLKKTASFTVRAVSEHSELVQRLEKRIEERGMTCRIYTENRGYVAGGAALLTGVGAAAIIGIAAHNVATWNPDYEIAKDFVDNKISVTFKKHPKVTAV